MTSSDRTGGESSPSSTHSTNFTSAESLLRTVIGIEDARIVAHPAGGVSVVRVICNDDASVGQIVRNVRSALFAGFGIAIGTENIDFVDVLEMPAIAAAVEALTPSLPKTDNGAKRGFSVASNAEPKRVKPPAPKPMMTPKYDSMNPAAFMNTSGGFATQTLTASRITQIEETSVDNGALVAATTIEPITTASAVGHMVRDIVASAAALRLESVEMRRQAGRLRCRVVISLGADHFGAVADSTDPNTGEVALAGRVACDALRAGGFTEARFDGAAMAHINGRQHVVVALHEWMGGETIVLSGAAPLEDLPERAAAIAAIKAVLAQDIN